MVLSIQELRLRLELPDNRAWCYPEYLSAACDSFAKLTSLAWKRAEDGQIEVCRRRCIGKRFRIPAHNVESVSLVETKCTASADWTVLAAEDWTLHGRKLTYTGIGDGFLEVIRVTYTGGYDSVVMAPGDVRLAILSEIKFLLVRLDDSKVALKTVAGQGASSVFEEGTHAPYFLEIAKSYAVSF